MANFNRIIMIGNLTRDPELRQLPSGQSICRLSIASNRQYRSKQSGETVQEVCFIDIDVWGAQAESCSKYLAKGRPALVEGRLKFDSWQAPDGSSRNKHIIVAERVVFLGGAQMGTEQNLDAETQELKSTLQDQNFEHAQQIASETQFTAAQKESSLTKTRKKKENEMPEANSNGMNFQDEPPFQDDLPY